MVRPSLSSSHRHCNIACRAETYIETIYLKRYLLYVKLQVYYQKPKTRLVLRKSLEPSHGVLQLLKKNFYSVLILHLLKPLFLVFHVFQALNIFFCFS